nr:FYN-binding protein 1-like isoform X2 [Nerophis lumbriciformis]
MDFKTLRAKFQAENVRLRQRPWENPTLSEKPKAVPPPGSHTHYLPAGARPSLLTSINQTVNGRSALGPKVVFKNEKKPLIKTDTNRSDGKLYGGKDKLMKGSREFEFEERRDKKLPGVTTTELVSAPAAPKAHTSKKKGFFGFKRSAKSVDIPADSVLDSPSLDISGPALLIPTPPEFEDSESDSSPSETPNMSSLSDHEVDSNLVPPGFSPPPAFIPDIPHLNLPRTLRVQPPPTSTPPISILDNQGDLSTAQITPTIYQAAFRPPPGVSSPPPVSVEALLNQPTKTRVSAPSPIQDENPTALFSALERAEDMRKPSPADQRVRSALEKATKKATSNVQRNSSLNVPSLSEDLHRPQSMLASFPPIDYDAMTAGQLNGIDHRRDSPTLDAMVQGGTGDISELLVVPTPPHRIVDPVFSAVPPVVPPVVPPAVPPAVPPKTPAKRFSAKTPDFIQPPALQEIPGASLEFSETDIRNVGRVDIGAGAQSAGPHIPFGVNFAPSNTGNVAMPGVAVQGDPRFTARSPVMPIPLRTKTSFPTPAVDGLAMRGFATDNYFSEDGAKKKTKIGGNKKRKKSLKNPYAEATRERREEKNKMGRFGKSDKKVVVEGPDEKELKKREKHRLEREKKEQKERQEKEKKEHKEREKRENEMNKKFKISGNEEAIYNAMVTGMTKRQKDDLPVENGDMVSIIRTTRCPKGRWLARDLANNFGYVTVAHLELDIKEMLAIGKKVPAATPPKTINLVDLEASNIGSRIPNPVTLASESFSDDSDWGDDENESSVINAAALPRASVRNSRAFSVPDVGHSDLYANQQYNNSDVIAGGMHEQARNEALQKLTTFFQSPKTVQPTASVTERQTSLVHHGEHEVHQSQASSVQDILHPDMLILPPPEMYADDSD